MDQPYLGVKGQTLAQLTLCLVQAEVCLSSLNMVSLVTVMLCVEWR